MTLPDWLDEGCAWLAQVQKIGLSMAGRELLERGRAWQEHGALLGWHQCASLFQALAQEDAPMNVRAAALLDLGAWLTTARRVLQAEALAASVTEQ
jgi:hypothetical protein